ncbi:MAG: ISAs1 family transposase [Chloroflexi bacterium]|nr:ISAs1 family transposase [Chloroflexota bacterium]
MESTAPTSAATTSAAPHLVAPPTTLLAAFAAVPDPRREASVTYPLPALLALAVAAILCAHTSVLAIAEWGARQSSDLLQPLGFTTGQTPCQSTLHRLFRKLDARAVAAALRQGFDDPAERKRGEEGVAVDGKAQRGRHQFQEGAGVVDVLTAFCQEHSVVLAEEPVEQGQGKAEAELTVAPRVIEQLDWQGRVLTGDALYCQRQLCQQVLDRGGDYLLTVKANQPTLDHLLRRTFDPQARPLLHCQEARTIDKGHGRIDLRQLRATADPLALPDWPGVAQVFRIERTWWEKGERHQQVRYGITSLPPQIGTAQRLLALKRKHWLTENRGHRAKDVTLGEDASLLHQGHAPSVFSVLRNIALSLLRRAGHHTITSRLRHHSQHPEEAVALLLHPPPTRA